MQYKDYYKILGVNKNSTEKEISKAYRNLARKYHPDVSKEKGSDAKFKDITEAYEVLGDKDKRNKYDTLGADWDKYQMYGDQSKRYQDRSDVGGNTYYGSDFSDFFEIFFGSQGSAFDGMFGGGGRKTKRTAQQQTQSRRTSQTSQLPKTEVPAHEIEITLKEAYHGGKRVITLQQDYEQKKLEVNIPKGVENGTKIRIPAGNQGEDLFLKIKIAEDKFFKLEKKDLHCEVPVTDYEAVLGTEVKIPTLSGSSINLKIPPHTQAGRTFRLKNLGMPILKSENKGDMYVKVKIVIPTHLTEPEMELYNQLKEQRSGKDNVRQAMNIN